MLKVSKQSALRRTVTDRVFYSLMRQSDVGIAHEALLNGEQLSSDSEDDVSYPGRQFEHHHEGHGGQTWSI